MNGDGMDDIIMVYRDGVDIGTYNIYSTSSAERYDNLADNDYLVIFDGNDGTPLYSLKGRGNGYNIYLVKVGEMAKMKLLL